MKKLNKPKSEDMRADYKSSDFPELVRGKYVARLQKSSNVVVIDPDISAYFPNAETVNAALRSLTEIVRRTSPTKRRAR